MMHIILCQLHQKSKIPKVKSIIATNFIKSHWVEELFDTVKARRFIIWQVIHVIHHTTHRYHRRLLTRVSNWLEIKTMVKNFYKFSLDGFVPRNPSVTHWMFLYNSVMTSWRINREDCSCVKSRAMILNHC